MLKISVLFLVLFFDFVHCLQSNKDELNFDDKNSMNMYLSALIFLIAGCVTIICIPTRRKSSSGYKKCSNCFGCLSSEKKLLRQDGRYQNISSLP